MPARDRKEYWDVTAFIKRPGQDKAWAQKIGSATPKDDGGFWISLNALPFSDGKSEVSIAISPPYEPEGGRDRDRGRGSYRERDRGTSYRSQKPQYDEDPDDELPDFASGKPPF